MTRIARRTRRALTRRTAAIVVAAAAVLAVVVPVGLGAQQAAPANTAQPTISGTPAVGQTLTGTQGTWSNSPTSYTYQWVRCGADGGAPDGSNCAVIGGASTTAYVVSSGDVGSRLRFRVTALNADGQQTSASNATAAVTAAQQGPPNTQPPTITGQAAVGQTLTANNGTWTGTGITYTYAWSRCDTAGANCAAISGATANTYKVVDADAGHTLRVQVTAKNTSGENSVTSAQTAVVTGGTAPPSSGCPAGTGPINVADLAQPARLSIGGQRITPSVVTRDTSVVRVSFRITACSGRSVVGALVYATPTPYQQFAATEQPTGSDGRAVLTMRRLRFFPASNQPQLLVVFVRARKSGEDLLGGVSTRRLVSFKVNLRG
jgi:hypothetical protein